MRGSKEQGKFASTRKPSKAATSKSKLRSSTENEALNVQVRLRVPRAIADDPMFQSRKSLLAVMQALADGRHIQNVQLKAVDWKKGTAIGRGGASDLKKMIHAIAKGNIRAGVVRDE